METRTNMKKKNVFALVGLSLALGMGVGAGIATNTQVKETRAVNASRYSVLIAEGSSWTNDNATTMFYDGETGYTAELTVDADIGSQITLWGQKYTLHTGLIDLDSIGNTWKNIKFARNVGGNWYDEAWGGWREGIKSGERNVIKISGTKDLDEWGDLYWKVVTYTGVEDYSDLGSATKSAELMRAGSSIAAPATAPNGLSFAGWYTNPNLTISWDGNVDSDLTLYAKYAADTRTYNKHYYYDGAVQGDIGVDTPEVGDTYSPATPDSPVSSKYYFAGWHYWDEDDITSNPFSPVTVESGDAVSIYAVYLKYEASADAYIYYVSDKNSATSNNIYTYGAGGKVGQFGDWPGTAVTSVAGQTTVEKGVISLGGTSGWIYKIPYNTLANDTHVIFNYVDGNDKTQTADLPLASNRFYWFDENGQSKYYDCGLEALAFARQVEAKRNAVIAGKDEHGKDVLNYSICGISASDALTLCNNYNALDESVRELVNISKTYTYSGAYDGENVPSETNVSFYDIMEELASRAGGVVLEGHSGAGRVDIMDGNNADNNMAFAIAAISGAVLVTFAGSFFLLRRKHQN